MTSQPDSGSFSVWIGDRRAGTIYRIGDRTRFSLDPDYRAEDEVPPQVDWNGEPDTYPISIDDDFHRPGHEHQRAQ